MVVCLYMESEEQVLRRTIRIFVPEEDGSIIQYVSVSAQTLVLP